MDNKTLKTLDELTMFYTSEPHKKRVLLASVHSEITDLLVNIMTIDQLKDKAIANVVLKEKDLLAAEDYARIEDFLRQKELLLKLNSCDCCDSPQTNKTIY